MFAIRIPLDRNVLITLESVLYATIERTLGFISPISLASCVARTELISISPKVLVGKINPGYRSCPFKSVTLSAPAGMAILSPTASIFPFVTLMVPLLITLPLPT